MNHLIKFNLDMSYDIHWLRIIEEMPYKTIQFNSISACRVAREWKIEIFTLPVCKPFELAS